MPETDNNERSIKTIRWIPVEEALPTYAQEVLVMGPAGGIEHGYFRKIIDENRQLWKWTTKGRGWKTVRWWIARDTLPPMPKYGKSLAVEYIEQEDK